MTNSNQRRNHGSPVAFVSVAVMAATQELDAGGHERWATVKMTSQARKRGNYLFTG